MQSLERQKYLQQQKELNDQARAKADATHIYKPTRSSMAYDNEVVIGGGSGANVLGSTPGGSYEPLITKDIGYARWSGTAWYFSNEEYSLSTHNHSTLYAPIMHNNAWSTITGTPTTLAGYGIIDDLSVAWANILNKPTTINGYGITDAFNGQYSSLTGKPDLIDAYGTPVDNQIAIWRDANTLEGTGLLTYSGGSLNVTGNIILSGTITIGADPGPSFWQYMPTGVATVSDILQWHVDRYKPYTYQSPGRLDSTTTNPIGTVRLNYDGYFYATKVYSGGTEVVTGMTYPGVGIALSTGTGWDSSIVNNSSNWNTAYGWGDHAGLYRPVAWMPTYSDVGAAPTIHNLIDTTNHPVTGLTSGHFLKATGATTYAFGAHGLSYGDVGAAAVAQTFYIGTTQVAINRASADLALTGITGVDAGDGSVKHLTLTAGDAITTTTAGDLILKAGSAVWGDNSTAHGGIYLSPGTGYTTLNTGCIYLGRSTDTRNTMWIQTLSTETNVTLVIEQKGTGYFQMGNSVGMSILRGDSVEVQANLFKIGAIGGDVIIKGYYSVSNTNAKNTIITGADAVGTAGNWNGGDLYLLGGQPYGTGTHGNLFLGTGSAGTAPLSGSGTGTSVIAYNRSTGQITYTDMNAAGITPVDNILDWDAGNSWYAPYATQSSGGKFDSGTVNPSSITRLNYDGYFYATSLRADHIFVGMDEVGSTYGYFSPTSMWMQVTGHVGTSFLPHVAAYNLNSPVYTANYINTYSTLTNNSAKLFSVRNNDTEAFQITANGGAYSARNIVNDYDNNEYHTVVIGNQEWIVENLKVRHDSSGVDIPLYGDYNDWFLPSLYELKEMSDVLHIGLGVGNFREGDQYWSSTEYSPTNARAWNFAGTPQEENYDKSTTLYVRACRSFTSVTPSYSLGDRGPAGGWIFWKSGTSYLECAPCDENAFYAWSNVVDAAVTNLDMAIGYGQTNTTRIIAQVGHTSSSASYCNDLTSNLLWTYDTYPAMCYYNNDTANRDIYGALYNSYALANLAYFTKNNVVDTGWRIPTNYDFLKLQNYLGGSAWAGGHLKELGVSHWTTPNTNATNSSGFTALPGGSRSTADGVFSNINILSSFYSSEGGFWYCDYNNNNFSYDGFYVTEGVSVRAVRDISVPARGVEETMCIYIGDETTDLTVSDGKFTFYMPYTFCLNPMSNCGSGTIGVKLCVNTVPSGTSIIVDITQSASSIFSTLPQIDEATYKSSSSATPGVLTSFPCVLWEGAEIQINIDQVGSTAAGKGLKVYLTGTRIIPD